MTRFILLSCMVLTVSSCNWMLDETPQEVEAKAAKVAATEKKEVEQAASYEKRTNLNYARGIMDECTVTRTMVENGITYKLYLTAKYEGITLQVRNYTKDSLEMELLKLQIAALKK